MVGQITLMQGPLGVAASARRVQPRPGDDTVGSPVRSSGADINGTPARPPHSASAKSENYKPDQELIESVAPKTLFEASRIAALLPPDSSAYFIPGKTAPEPWQPPYSPFHLRDRSI